MSPGTAETLLLAGGGLLASEASGITNVTPVGSSSGEGPQRPTIPTPGTPPTQLPPGLNLGELFSNFAGPGQLVAAFEAGAGAGQGIGSDALIQAFQQGAGAATQGAATVGGAGGESVPTVQEIVDEVRNSAGLDLDPGPGGRDSGARPDAGSAGGDSSFDLQDLDQRGPLGIGTWLAATGESGVAIGSTAEDVGGGLRATADAVGSPGRPAPGEEGDFFGQVYQAGQTTGAAINEGRAAYDRADQRYRDATSGARETVQTAKDVSRPWRWDVDAGTAANVATPFNTGGLPDVGGLSPVGTASASRDTEQEPQSISVLDRSQSPQAGTPTPAELEAAASSSSTSGGRDAGANTAREVPTVPDREDEQAGSTGATLVK